MLDKSIEHGKENRKPYRKSKRFDRSCRNHGSCFYCECNRTAKESAKKQTAGDAIREYEFQNKTPFVMEANKHE